MSASSTATVSVLSIATDLGIHVAMLGVPMPTSAEFFASEKGLAFAGTVSGIGVSAIQGGVVSGKLNDVVSRISAESDRMLVNQMIATGVIATKLITQTSVAVAYTVLGARPMSELMDYGARILLPQLLVHSLLAEALPMMIK
jgi:hypothetical protein